MPRTLHPSATTWLAAAVLILLPLLAVLQYRWLSQIGEEAGARMQAVAANAGAALTRDLKFEVGRAWRERAGVGGAIEAEGAGTAPSLVVDALVIDRSATGSGDGTSTPGPVKTSPGRPATRRSARKPVNTSNLRPTGTSSG